MLHLQLVVLQMDDNFPFCAVCNMKNYSWPIYLLLRDMLLKGWRDLLQTKFFNFFLFNWNYIVDLKKSTFTLILTIILLNYIPVFMVADFSIFVHAIEINAHNVKESLFFSFFNFSLSMVTLWLFYDIIQWCLLFNSYLLSPLRGWSTLALFTMHHKIKCMENLKDRRNIGQKSEEYWPSTTGLSSHPVRHHPWMLIQLNEARTTTAHKKSCRPFVNHNLAWPGQ